MLTDYNLIFADNQECLSTTTSTNVVDTESSIDTSGYAELGAGTPVWCIVTVHTTFSGTLAGSVASAFYAEVQECATSGATYTQLIKGKEQTNTLWVAGDTMLAQPLPAHHLRYLRTRVVSTGISGNAGNVDSYLSFIAPRKPSY